MARPKSREYDALTAAEKEAIVSLYKGCADQKEQIKICAELHSTTVGVVRRVLEEAGWEVPPHPGHRAAVSNKESKKKVERTAPPDRSAFSRVEDLLGSVRPGDGYDVRISYRTLALQLCEQIVDEYFEGVVVT